LFNNKTILAQAARREFWANLTLSLLVAAFAFAFIPFTYESPVAWSVGLFALSYVLVHYSMGLRSWVTLDKGKYTLHIRERTSNYLSRQIPFESIKHIEFCEYELFGQPAQVPDGVDEDYYYVYALFAYQGPGLIICYQLPVLGPGGSIMFGVRIPSPRANEFMALVKTNTSLGETDGFTGR